MSNDFVKESQFGPPRIGALMRIPAERAQKVVLARLHERGFDDFERTYFAVFRYPGPQGARPTDLAAQTGTSMQALNYLLRELEHRGYLTREPDPDDRRSKRIALTQRGIDVFGVIRDANAEIEAVWTQRLGTRRFAMLRDLLLDLQDPD